MKIKSFLIFSLLLSSLVSRVSFAQEEDYIPTDADIATEETYIPEESVQSTEQPVILDDSDSATVEGASDYEY